MRVLILGGSGMLGHKLWQVLRDHFDTWITLRSTFSTYLPYNLFDTERLLNGVNVFDFPSVMRAVATVHPSVIINSIGIIKQLPESKDPIASLMVNSLFPHLLAELCQATAARLIHISTDCVFSGHKGMYNENDLPDAEDLYGRSKLLGEVNNSNCLTLRTSVIGRELGTSVGIVEWFLSNEGQRIRGYTNAIYSGFPTIVFAEIVANIIERHPSLSGLYHVSSEPISKHELLCLLRSNYKVSVEIEPYPDIHIDRSLDSSRFKTVTGFIPLPWPEMAKAMVTDPMRYR